MAGKYPEEFREDVVAVAKNREAGVSLKQIGLPPEVGPRVMRAAVSSMGTDFSILSRAAVPER